MKHLARNVCDGCAVWCQFDATDWSQPRDFGRDDIDHYTDGYTSNPSEATCRECLATAAEHGEECAVRADSCMDPTCADPECTR